MLANMNTANKPRTVLIIDDEIKILLGLRVLLERNGYKVIVCENGSYGLKMTEEVLPDLIICDVMLPMMNGYQVKEKISANPRTKDIPFLFLSARASKADKINGFAAGADDYITKPFDPQELAARIHAIFRRQDDAKREMNQQIERVQSEISYKLQTSIAQQMFSHIGDKTEEHGSHVIGLIESLARELGLEEQVLEHIRMGAHFHDIGMTGIPDAIYFKPGPLTDEEHKAMMTHVNLGKEILQTLKLPSTVVDLVYHHHERWDGSGYPDGLAGEGIPLAARIFAIINVWDALTSDRTYRKAWSEEKSIAYIKEQAGKYFDPYIAEKFLYIIQRENKGR